MNLWDLSESVWWRGDKTPVRSLQYENLPSGTKALRLKVLNGVVSLNWLSVR